MLKTFTTNFTNLTKQAFLRPNFGYRYFFDIQNAEVYPYKKQLKLKYVITEITSKKMKKWELKQEETLVDIGNIEKRFNNLINLEKIDKIWSDKNILQNGDIVIPKLQPQMGNLFLNLEHKRYLASTELLEYQIEKNYNPSFLYYLFTSKKFLLDLAKLESGKTHRRVNSSDLLKIKIPLIPKPTQDQIVAQITPIETKIKELKEQIQAPRKIINQVFAKEFGFDLDKFEESKKEKFFTVDFTNVFKNNLTRVSTHFHHSKLIFVEKKLKNKDSWIPIKNIFNLSGGKRVPKGKEFSSEETDYYYLRPAEINVWGIDRQNMLNISKEVFDGLKRYNIKTGEFAISIVGTLGKTALVDTEKLEIEKENLILSENFIKLIPKKEINKQFYYYFFYSFIFEAQTEREYTMTSIKKLGIDKWNYIKIPNLPLSHQQTLVSQIKTQLDQQENIKKEIEQERSKIDQIVEQAIK